MKPILMSTPMVRATLNGAKSQTRRIIKIPDLIESPDRFKYVGNSDEFEIPHPAKKYDTALYHSWELLNNNMPQWVISSHRPGDKLWVRETFAYQTPSMGPGDETPDWTNYIYKADNPDPDWRNGKWKPSIFMPREACRLFLEVTDIRVERLQEISEQDAMSEGISLPNYAEQAIKDVHYPEPSAIYADLWDSINGKGSWEKNPWVFKISFKRVDKPTSL